MRALGLPIELVNRHPFLGTGLAIRIPGDITQKKLDLLRQVDAIYLRAKIPPLPQIDGQSALADSGTRSPERTPR